MNPIYFDNNATTAIAPEVIEAMQPYLLEHFGNPSSFYSIARCVRRAVEEARAQIAGLLGATAEEVIFTSCGTESDNAALNSALEAFPDRRHVITTAVEHPAVLNFAKRLQGKGYRVTFLPVDRKGQIDCAHLRAVLADDTAVVSVMHANNETGVMQPIAELAAMAAEAGVLFHVDAAQAAGKFAIDLQQIPIDLLALSAHKFHGPKGVGCLVVRNRRHLRLQPLMYGGGQEFGLRPGTLATHQIVGLSTALSLAGGRREADLAHVTELKRQFLGQLGAHLSFQVHGDPGRCSPYIVNFAIPGVSSDALINQLAADVAIASGSACSSGTVEPSTVLRAMGIEGDPLYGAVRLSFSRDHTIAEVILAVERIVAAVRRMQELDG